MADQTVKLTSDSGTPERVAFDIWSDLLDRNSEEFKRLKTADELLGLYRRCLWAVGHPKNDQQ